MIGNLKEIVSLFTKIPPENITDITVIDRGAVGSSVILHRMYSKLANAGYVINDFHSIKTFGDLFQQLNGNSTSQHAIVPDSPKIPGSEFILNGEMPGAGIDIEDLSSMPIAVDFREDMFYVQNFTQSEISYCILKQNPYATFAGLFAAKEAINKADNRYANMPFNLIEIQHDKNGKPYFPGYSISISHTELIIVAVAIYHKYNEPFLVYNNMVAGEKNNPLPRQNKNLVLGLAILALITSIVALGMILIRSTI